MTRDEAIAAIRRLCPPGTLEALRPSGGAVIGQLARRAAVEEQATTGSDPRAEPTTPARATACAPGPSTEHAGDAEGSRGETTGARGSLQGASPTRSQRGPYQVNRRPSGNPEAESTIVDIQTPYGTFEAQRVAASRAELEAPRQRRSSTSVQIEAVTKTLERSNDALAAALEKP